MRDGGGDVAQFSVSTRVEVNREHSNFVTRDEQRLHARGGEPEKGGATGSKNTASPRAWR